MALFSRALDLLARLVVTAARHRPWSGWLP
jgi:hypothetical protein